MFVDATVVLFLVQFCVVAWVFWDASRRDWSVTDSVARSARVWAFAVLMLAIVALPCYLRRRRAVPLRFTRSALATDAAAGVEDPLDLSRWADPP